MADLESGLKWWMRYVIVPIVAGGGVITIIVAMMDSKQMPFTKPSQQSIVQSPNTGASQPTQKDTSNLGSVTVVTSINQPKTPEDRNEQQVRHDRSPGVSSSAPQHEQSGLHEVTIMLYNDVNDPKFSVDDKPTRATRYSSGIATFSLSRGTHLVRAEYSTRTCSASVSVPLSEPGPVSANCSLKGSGGA